MRSPTIVTALLLLLLLPAAAPAAVADAAKPDHVRQVEAALPAAAPAKPKQARRILLYSRTNGFRHTSIPLGIVALSRMGERTGAYAVEHSEDPAVITAANLARFDAVVMLNTTGEAFGPTALKKGQAADADPGRAAALAHEAQAKAAFLAYVAGGKGLVGIHAATDTYGGWPEYVAMIGGSFAGHPWHKEVPITLDEPDHPCTRCFAGDRVTIADEIYQYRDWKPGEVRTLLRLDRTWSELAKGKMADGDYPVGWVKPHGQGRVFYCNLGHREATYWNPQVLQHYLAGIQFACGDLEAPFAPRAAAR